MRKNKSLPSEGRKARGGKFIPALCNIIGILILLSVIGTCLPVTVPQFLGYGVYNVVSGSMEPEIPIGSVIYVQPVEPETIAEGDVIAFQSGESVIAHRVVKNQTVEGSFKTKGDANAGEDMNDVDYASLIGRIIAHYPMLGAMLELYTSNVGKAYAICFAACGAMLNILAGRMRERAAQKAARR
ncbi:signal peptidase I [Lachnospiraceae bacterium 29-84]